MNLLLLLLIIHIGLFVLTIIENRGKLISPSSIYFISWIVMLALGFAFSAELEITISINTFWIIFISGILFHIVELYFLSIKGKLKRSHTQQYGTSNAQEISLKKAVLWAVLIINIVYLFLALYSVFSSTGGGSFASRMNVYKTAILFGTSKVRFQFLIAQLFKISTALSYVVAYIWIHNYIVAKRKFITNWKYTLIALSYIVGTFVSQGARQPAIEFVLYCIVIFISFHLRDVERKKIFNIVKKAIPVVVLLGVLYYYTMALAGRSQTPRKLVEYIAANFAGGLYYLNYLVNKTWNKPPYFGQNSFSEIYKILVTLHLAPQDARITVHENNRYGNTVTLLGRWYEDFGDIGVYIMVILVAIFFCWLFYSKLLKKNNSKIHLTRIMYAKLLMSLVWAGYDDRIRALLAFGSAVQLLLIYLVYLVLIKKKIKLRVGARTTSSYRPIGQGNEN